MDDKVAQTDIGNVFQPSQAPAWGSDDFSKRVVEYFGLYVDGGLSASGLPPRIYAGTYKQGLIRKLPLDRYPQLHKNIYKNFIAGLTQETFVITQNKYTSQPDERILDAVSTNIAKISERELLSLLRALAFQAGTRLIESNGDQKDTIDDLLEASKTAISHDLVVPFILPFEDVDVLTDKASKRFLLSLQEDAVSRLYDASREHLRQIYTGYFASETYVTKDSLMAILAKAFTPALVKNSLRVYVEHLHIGDAYQHTYALHRSTAIADDTSMYLYFGELTYESHSFPLFYTKVDSKHTYPSVTLSFENRIYINKQAIEYVIRHFSARTNQYIDVTTLHIPDVIYGADEVGVLQQVVTSLCDVLKLSDPITLSKPTPQESSNHLILLTNRQYFYVDTLFGPEIHNEYTAINENDTLRRKATSYIDSLLAKPQNRLVEETDEAWDEKSHIEKLLPTVPLAVNDEQKKVLTVLKERPYEHIVVDAAVSTGKSHLITATVLDRLAKGQKVLVVSNNTVSARKVRHSVGEALRGASGSAGHNPVFTIHENALVDQIDDQVIAEIADTAQLVESKYAELETAKKRKKRALKEGLTQFTQNAEEINLHEVEQTVFNERRFAGKNWIEDEPIDEMSTVLQELHHAIQYVNASEASYLMPYIESNQQKAIEDFIGAYNEYLKASKTVHERLPEFIVGYRKLSPEQKNVLQESLDYIHSNQRQFMKILKAQSENGWLTINDSSTFRDVSEQEKILTKLLEIAYSAEKVFHESDKQLLLNELDNSKNSPSEIIDAYDTYIEQIAALKSRLFGFSGRTLVIENLNKQLLKSLPNFGLPEPEKQSENMQVMNEFIRYVLSELESAGLAERYWKDIINILLTDSDKIEEIEQIISSLNQTVAFDFVQTYKINQADNLTANITMLKYATELNRLHKEHTKLSKLFGITTIGRLLARPQEFVSRIDKLSHDLNEANRLEKAKQTIQDFIHTYQDATERLGLHFTDGNLTVDDESFADADSEYVKEYVAHKRKEQDVREYFEGIMTDSFSSDSDEYRQILGVELQHTLNKNFLQSLNTQGESVTTIAAKLKQQRQLTADETAKLIELFPCVTGEVRSLGSLLPLVPDMFDLVIVDTADSVAVADVLPAVLRAKRVLVIGDSAQSNVAMRPIHSAANDLHIKQITAALKDKLKSEPADIKNSIIAKQQGTLNAHMSALDFYASYANYQTTLTKQYGAYEELTAFANTQYYANIPVPLTSHTAQPKDIFTFTAIKPKNSEVSRFTNSAEVEHIIKHLHKLKDQGYRGTIGIVTPFEEQALLLQKELDECVITDWFERRQLQVMTFDTLRQHPKDYLYYSLVASEEFNEIPQRLPRKIGEEEFTGDTRSRRLLRGFSGAKRKMHIVHSLPIDTYAGSLAETLQFFNNLLQTSSSTAKGGATDILLAMEATLKQSFEKTNFVKKHENDVSFIAKYPFVNYIKPLSPQYHKAVYKMFFLVMVNDTPLVIEFDDFKDRFLQNSKNDKGYGGMYLTAEDVYAYELLGGYGYRFLRLNKFNIGSDPVKTLDSYLSQLLKEPRWPSDNGFIG